MGDPLRTWRNMLGTKEKWKNPSAHPCHPKLKRKKIQVLWMHALADPLATCIFGFQNCWSPYLASANGRGRNWTRKKNKKQISRHSWMLQFFSFRGGTGTGIFFPSLFPICSYHVPKWFPSSQCPHIKFPNYYFDRVILQIPTLIFCLPKFSIWF
jgi:hypothetical protein